MRLSKITETKKGRMALFGEADEFLFSVDAETYYKYGLCEGCELDAAALAGLQAASETRRAKDKALGYLALRSYGSQELYEKLCLKFDGPSSAAAVAAPWSFGRRRLCQGARTPSGRAEQVGKRDRAAAWPAGPECRGYFRGNGGDIAAERGSLPCRGGKALPCKAGRRPAGKGAGGTGAAGVFLR